MAKTKTRRWDAADYLKSEKDIIAYLEAALEEGDAALFTAALGDVARAKGMAAIARKPASAAKTSTKHSPRTEIPNSPRFLRSSARWV